MSFDAKGVTGRRVSAPDAEGRGACRPVVGEPVDQCAQSTANALPLDVPLLFIDASAPRVQAGVWQGGRWLAYRCMEAPALEEVFRSVSLLLKEAELRFTDLGGFIHNEGPGSILGIRLAAMALRIWALGLGDLPSVGTVTAPAQDTAATASATARNVALPVWAVRSLPLLAAKMAFVSQRNEAEYAAAQSASGAVEVGGVAAEASVVGGVFSEFRQGLWNWYTPGGDDVFGDTIEVIETEELAERLARAPQRCWHLRHRKNWEAPPVAVQEVETDLADCPQVLLLPGLLRRVAAPEALLTRAPEFKTTSGERHRGAGQAAAAAGEPPLPETRADAGWQEAAAANTKRSTSEPLSGEEPPAAKL